MAIPGALLGALCLGWCALLASAAPLVGEAWPSAMPTALAERRPGHLLVGECGAGDRLLHAENIVLDSDRKSQISASLKIQIEAPVNITCAKVHYDQDGDAVHPQYAGGGPGHNFVIFNVDVGSRKGFRMLFQLYGQ